MSRTTIHIAIGNSDDKLTQAEWSDYVTRVDSLVRTAAGQVHGYWHSMPDAPWQNAAWAFVLSEGHFATPDGWLKRQLERVAHRYGQDSVAWNESVTEFIEAKP